MIAAWVQPPTGAGLAGGQGGPLCEVTNVDAELVVAPGADPVDH
jgi:hypothetical protein